MSVGNDLGPEELDFYHQQRLNRNTEVEPFGEETRQVIEDIHRGMKRGLTTGFKHQKYEEYTVQVGDTLNSIAFKQKTNTRLLRKVNNVLTDNLLPGEVILVPSIVDKG